MTKPWELAALKDKLLAKVKPVIVPIADATLEWVGESCALSEGAIVKGVGAVVVAVKPAVLAEIEKAVK